MGLKVAVLYNLRREILHHGDAGDTASLEAEYDTQETVDALLAAVEQAGHGAIPIEVDLDCLANLRRHRPDIAFNIAEGLPGPGREAQAPAMCEMAGVPHTGSGVLTLALGLNKAMTKRVLLQHGIATPAFRVIPPDTTASTAGLRFPLFVKPVREGSSMGISPRSVVRTPEELAAQVNSIHAAYNQPALVEEFLEGREFTIGILGNAEPTVLPITEINYAALPAGYPPVYTYQFKKEWEDDRLYPCPAQVDGALERALKDTALATYRAVNCLDVGRVDLRLDAAGVPHVLEINPLPGMAPGFSDLPRQADAAGMTYPELVRTILDRAIARYGL